MIFKDMLFKPTGCVGFQRIKARIWHFKTISHWQSRKGNTGKTPEYTEPKKDFMDFMYLTLYL